jgi:AcrR family transcriptional regulator
MTVLMLPGREVAVPAPGSPSERIVDATLRCVARWGMAKTTVDDVAREAGVGRATLYRLFPGGRDALFEAAAEAETARFFARLDSRLVGVDSLEDLLVTAVVEAGTTLARHPALQFLLAHEPEAILPHLAFQQMDAVLGTVGALAGPYLSPWLPPGPGVAEAAARGAEWVARIVLAYLVAPAPDVDVCEPSSVRRLVRTYILPGLVPANP